MRPVPGSVPPAPTTRFAPAPTGYLHTGHVANAIYVWGVARANRGRVVLRIEDHDRGRCRPLYETALLEDLAWLGFVPDEPDPAAFHRGISPYRQGDSAAAYERALERLRAGGLVYACSCSRLTFATWARTHGRPWSRPGCPGGCRQRRLPEGSGLSLRIAIGDGDEAFDDLLAGPTLGIPAGGGDLIARTRDGDWSYAFAVVVDDARHGIDLVVRGRDLLDDTARQIRLGRLLGRPEPPAFLHHPLILRPDGAKLSKADGDTAVRELRAAGMSETEVIGRAAAAVGLQVRARPIRAEEVARLFEG